ncbi:hypothetical protein Rvan_2744 [Rhodomicrobium vannielii ATCC 17100]|uniref:Uncharacterized protein n=2 Tax=Rhodomicrobium vannielii TaxID=1069 RepID=E3I829_RHOVT|nr:hypothetical protein Rvan_2744 [Rhodomicrobium vannielii ATCC 17100]
MRHFLTTLIALSVSSAAFAGDDGTYVEPHYQTRPNNNLNDNFSTKGNVNPYTGREGWIDPNRNSYGSGSSNDHRSGYSNGWGR